jgi:hypothetical protein
MRIVQFLQYRLQEAPPDSTSQMLSHFAERKNHHESACRLSINLSCLVFSLPLL